MSPDTCFYQIILFSPSMKSQEKLPLIPLMPAMEEILSYRLTKKEASSTK